MTQETRVARIGIYTDKMVLSVMEQDGEGKSFCLYRKETQEDFLGKRDQVDREKLLLEAGKMMELSQKLLCDQTVCVGMDCCDISRMISEGNWNRVWEYRYKPFLEFVRHRQRSLVIDANIAKRRYCWSI